MVQPSLLQLGHGEPTGVVILLALILSAVKPIDLVPQPLALNPEQRERAHSDDLACEIGLDLTLTTQLPDGVAEWIQPRDLGATGRSTSRHQYPVLETHGHGTPLCHDVVEISVLGCAGVGPGSGLSEEPMSKVRSVALDFRGRCCVRRSAAGQD
jgi:hypothetical protein